MCECEKVHRLWKIDRHYLQNSSLSSSIIQKKTFLCSLRSQMKFNKNSNCEASKRAKKFLRLVFRLSTLSFFRLILAIIEQAASINVKVPICIWIMTYFNIMWSRSLHISIAWVKWDNQRVPCEGEKLVLLSHIFTPRIMSNVDIAWKEKSTRWA